MNEFIFFIWLRVVSNIREFKKRRDNLKENEQIKLNFN